MTYRLLLTPPLGELPLLTARLLPLLPPWRRAQALRFRTPLGQWQCAQAYLLLADLLREAGYPHPVTFDYLPHGKPVLNGVEGSALSKVEGPHFSISHCAEAVLCVVDDRGPVGCDVESFTEPDEALLRLTCSDSERHVVKASAEPSAAFARLWTQKEAVLKCLGDGLTDDLPSVLPVRIPSGYQLVTQTDTAHAFAFTLCYKGQQSMATFISL